MSKQISIPLFWKFSIAIVATVIIFGFINFYLLKHSFYSLIEKELNQHGKITAANIAERSTDFILYEDIVSLTIMVNDYKNSDPGIAYIFITDAKNNIIVHTFNDNPPESLVKINQLSGNRNLSVITYTDSVKIRDFAYPILDGNLGSVRIGFKEDNITRGMKSSFNTLLIMIIVFLIIGILGAFLFASIITKPINKIALISKNLNLNELDQIEKNYQEIFSSSNATSFYNFSKINDEIDVLKATFSEMLLRLKNTYTELKQTQKSLIQSEKMTSLGILSAGIAHEINNPITGIKNCLRRVAESPENIRQNIQYIELMSDAISNIERVIGGLLNFSKKHEFVFSEVNLETVIEKVLILTSFQLEKSGITIIKNISSENCIIYGSQNHLIQVVLNIVLNSIDAVDEKKAKQPDYIGEIKFSIYNSEKETTLEIADNGIGMDENKLSYIFDPFFTEKKIKQGIGLGLSVSYEIIEKHNGLITAKNNDKGGLTIKIIFKKSKVADNEK